jgi:hypothetical protein
MTGDGRQAARRSRRLPSGRYLPAHSGTIAARTQPRLSAFSKLMSKGGLNGTWPRRRCGRFVHRQSTHEGCNFRLDLNRHTAAAPSIAERYAPDERNATATYHSGRPLLVSQFDGFDLLTAVRAHPSPARPSPSRPPATAGLPPSNRELATHAVTSLVCSP